MRDILIERNLYQVIFEEVVTKLADVFKVDVARQRFDSVHIFSNMRHLGTISLVVEQV
jgi:hypothetical protein